MSLIKPTPKEPDLDVPDEVEDASSDLDTDLAEGKDVSTTGVWGEDLDIEDIDIDDGP